MKSKIKEKILTVAALSLALTVLFSLSAFAATSTTITLNNNSDASDTIALDWPNETCLVNVTGLAANDKATIIVYKGTADLSSLSKDDILYLKQGVADAQGKVAFSFTLRGSGTSSTDWFDYYAGNDNIKVAVGSSAANVTAPQYSAITVAYGDEIESISINWDNVNADTVLSDLDVTIHYANVSQTTTLKADADNIAVTGFSNGVATTLTDVSVALDTLNHGEILTDHNDVQVAGTDATEKNVSITFNNNGSEYFTKSDLSVYDNGTIKLPEAPATKPAVTDNENWVFLGWAKKDNNQVESFYPAGGKYPTKDIQNNDDLTFEAQWIDYVPEDVSMKDGASLRVHGTPYGMRFSTDFDDDFYKGLKGAIENLDDATEVTYGTIIAPYDYITAIEGASDSDRFTIEAFENAHKTYLNIIHSSFAEHTFLTNTGIVDLSEKLNVDLIHTINSVISNIRDSNYNRQFAARGYMKLTYSDGTERYFYTTFTQENVRKVSKVASDALADNSYMSYIDTLSNKTDVISTLNNYAGAYTE